MYRRVAIILLAASAGSAFAAEPACTTTVAPPAELAAWTSPGAMKAGNMSANAPLLAIGKAADTALLPTSAVHYAVRPEKPGGSANYGGLLGVDVKHAGTYRIALSTAAWIDVAGADRALQSAAHGHGAECTGIRKTVDFALAPGHYTVQISASGAPRITMLVVPAR